MKRIKWFVRVTDDSGVGWPNVWRDGHGPLQKKRHVEKVYTGQRPMEHKELIVTAPNCPVCHHTLKRTLDLNEHVKQNTT